MVARRAIRVIIVALVIVIVYVLAGRIERIVHGGKYGDTLWGIASTARLTGHEMPTFGGFAEFFPKGTPEHPAFPDQPLDLPPPDDFIPPLPDAHLFPPMDGSILGAPLPAPNPLQGLDSDSLPFGMPPDAVDPWKNLGIPPAVIDNGLPPDPNVVPVADLFPPGPQQQQPSLPDALPPAGPPPPPIDFGPSQPLPDGSRPAFGDGAVFPQQPKQLDDIIPRPAWEDAMEKTTGQLPKLPPGPPPAIPQKNGQPKADPDTMDEDYTATLHLDDESKDVELSVTGMDGKALKMHDIDDLVDMQIDFKSVLARLRRWVPYYAAAAGEHASSKVLWQAGQQAPQPQSDLPSVVSWAQGNPDYTRRFADERTRDQYISSVVSSAGRGVKFLERIYAGLPADIIRLDFFKYLALFTEGGAYADYDSIAHRGVDDWYAACMGGAATGKQQTGKAGGAPKQDSFGGLRRRAGSGAQDIPGLIVGIEMDLYDDPVIDSVDGRRIYVASYALAAARGHPVLARTLARISDNYIKRADGFDAAEAAARSERQLRDRDRDLEDAREREASKKIPGFGAVKRNAIPPPPEALPIDPALAPGLPPPGQAHPPPQAGPPADAYDFPPNPLAQGPQPLPDIPANGLGPGPHSGIDKKPESNRGVPPPMRNHKVEPGKPIDAIHQTPSAVHDWSGRGALTDSLMEYLFSIAPGFPGPRGLKDLKNPIRVGDVCILPISAFGAGQASLLKSPDVGEADAQGKVFVRHFAVGAWKADQ
ncbi:membrane-bound alpha-1,6-mannosyltransferase Initiation-specific [Savitreella phatthalungensis]